MSHHSDRESPIEAQRAAPPVFGNQEAMPMVSHAPPARDEGGGNLIQNKLAVLAALFLVTGFLGLPLLWMNRQFSAVERLFWSVVIIIYSLILTGITVFVIWWSYRQIAM